MRPTLTDGERAELQAPQRSSRDVRHWRHSQAVIMTAWMTQCSSVVSRVSRWRST